MKAAQAQAELAGMTTSGAKYSTIELALTKQTTK